MLINLLPDFFAVLNSTDRVAAYQQYFESYRARLMKKLGLKERADLVRLALEMGLM